MSDYKIDFVITWVDGNDEKWLEEKNKYAIDNQYASKSLANRYRDWNNLKYWFRGVEKFAPWVNNVYFITCGQCPEWLNLNHPKLKFVKHEDYIPKEYLPTFSANPIELNLYRINELSENFVYFNDDTFITSPIDKNDFFEDGKPKYIAGCDGVYAVNYNDTFAHILLNDASIINENYDKNSSIKKNFFKWFNLRYDAKTLLKTFLLLPFKHFPAFAEYHLPSPLLKSTIEDVWNKDFEFLDKTSLNKFRTPFDINQYVFKWYDIARGNFVPSKKLGRYYDLKISSNKLLIDIKKQKNKLICFSDDMEIDFDTMKKDVIDAFQSILPEKSSFEK